MFEPELSGSMLNDEWLSESTVQDPTPLPKIPGYRLLIRPVPIRTKTKGGIILPDKAKDDIYKGVRLIICYDDEITMVVEDPSSLDPMFNLSN